MVPRRPPNFLHQPRLHAQEFHLPHFLGRHWPQKNPRGIRPRHRPVEETPACSFVLRFSLLFSYPFVQVPLKCPFSPFHAALRSRALYSQNGDPSPTSSTASRQYSCARW